MRKRRGRVEDSGWEEFCTSPVPMDSMGLSFGVSEEVRSLTSERAGDLLLRLPLRQREAWKGT